MSGRFWEYLPHSIGESGHQNMKWREIEFDVLTCLAGMPLLSFSVEAYDKARARLKELAGRRGGGKNLSGVDDEDDEEAVSAASA